MSKEAQLTPARQLEKARRDVSGLRSEINRITGDFNALGAERDSARALLWDIANGPYLIPRELCARIAKELGD